MKLLERILLGILLVIAGGMVIHTPVTLWLGVQFPAYELFIKAWKEVLMGIALVLLLVVAAKRAMIDKLLSDRLLQLSLVFAGLHFVMMAAFQDGLQAAGAGLLIDLRFVLYFVLVYGFITLFPTYRRLFIMVLTGGAVVVLGFALLQLFVLPKDVLASIGYDKQTTIAPYLTVDENPAYVRINSTLRGPNPLGAYAVIIIGLLTGVALRWKVGRKGWILGGIAAGASLLALWASYSRSSAIAAIAAVIVIGIITVSPKLRQKLVIAAVAVSVVASGLLYVFRDTTFVSNVILHDSPTTGAHIDSNSGHAESLVHGVSRMLRQPFGAGVGSTGSASLLGNNPFILENQYLLIAHEVGWVGLAVFVWLYGELLRRLWQRRQSALALGVLGSGIGLAIIGLLLPVWTDDTVSIIWWGLAAVAVGATETGRKHGKRKSN